MFFGVFFNVGLKFIPRKFSSLEAFVELGKVELKVFVSVTISVFMSSSKGELSFVSG